MNIKLFPTLMALIAAPFCLKAEAKAKLAPEASAAISSMRVLADAQIKNPTPNISTRDANMAPFYLGLIELSRVSGDPKYWAQTYRLGESAGWSLKDDEACALAWLETFIAENGKLQTLDAQTSRMLFAMRKIGDAHVKSLNEAKKLGLDNAAARVKPKSEEVDELFAYAAPMARLYAATKNKAYLDYIADVYRFSSSKDHLNPYRFAALAMILRDIPASEASLSFFESEYSRTAEAILKAQDSDGLWDLDASKASCIAPALYIYGLANGANSGRLVRDKYWNAALRGWNALSAQVKAKGAKCSLGEKSKCALNPASAPAFTGAYLLAGSEIVRGFGVSCPKPDDKLSKAAHSIFSQPKPKAYAHLEPRRADDLAWENDKMAFRIYGPALYSGTENSGVDVWVKAVNYPVLDKWYALDFLKISAYHSDIGEGLDNYGVGDTVGCGGNVIYKDGKLFRSNVYRKCDIIWTNPDRLEFVAYYLYEDVEGAQFSERKVITLALGADRCISSSQFKKGNFLEKPFEKLVPVVGLEIATGLRIQRKGAPKYDEEAKSISISEKYEGKTLTQFLELSKTTKLVKFETIKNECMAIIKTDAQGYVSYSFGFTWVD